MRVLPTIFHIQLQAIIRSPKASGGTFVIDGVDVEFLKIGENAITIGTGIEGDAAINHKERIDQLTFESSVSIDGQTFLISQINDYAFYKTDIGKITFVGDINKIGSHAFEESNIAEVEFQNLNSFSEIPNMCFYKCSKLQSITIPKIKTVGEKAFYECAITSFDFSEVEIVKEYAFAYSEIKLAKFASPLLNELPEGTFYASELETITLPPNLISIGGLCFSESQLLSITTPSTLETIGERAFKACIKLTTADFRESTNFKNLQASTFEDSLISKVLLPSSIVYIQDRCFYSCSHLNEIELPTDLEEIGESAFASCTTLQHIEMLGTQCSKIYTQAFYGCTDLDTVTFSDKLNIIGDKAFALTQTSLVLLTSCSEIGREAFYQCTQLTDVDLDQTDITELPESIFKECKSLNNIILPGKLIAIQQSAFAYCESLPEIKFPETLETLGSGAFFGCSALGGIDMTDTQIAFLPNSSFRYCTNLEYVKFPDHNMDLDIDEYSFSDTGLIRVKIPPNCINVGYDCFENCKRLESIDFSESKLDRLRGYILCNCPNLVDLILPEGLGSMWAYSLSNTGITTFQCSTINELASQVFVGCKKLERVDFSGSTFTYIGIFCFDGCTSLKEVILPETVQEIRRKVFYGCVKLEKINFPRDLNYLQDEVFTSCNSLITVDFRNSKLDTIDGVCFLNCLNLTNIYWSPYIETVGMNIFKGCNKINKITLQSSMKALSKEAFARCGVYEADMTEFEGLIGPHLFSRCDRLKVIRWPKKPFSIDDRAFTMCPALEEVILPSTVTAIAGSAFRGSTAMTLFDMGQTSLETVSEFLIAGNSATTKFVFPPNLTTVESGVFVNVPLKDAYYGGFNDLSGLNKNMFPNPNLTIHVTRDYPAKTFAGINVTKDYIPSYPAEDEESSSIIEEEITSSIIEEETSSLIEEESSSDKEEESSSAKEEESSSAKEEEDISSAKEEESSSAKEEEEESSSAAVDDEDTSSGIIVGPGGDGDGDGNGDDELDEDEEDPFSVWSVVGGAVGGTVIFIGIILAACFIMKRSRRKLADEETLVSGLTDPTSWILSDTQINLNDTSARTLWNDYIVDENDNGSLAEFALSESEV